jgi:hypothetical protein
MAKRFILIAEKGALDDVEATRKELSRTDSAVIEYKKGFAEPLLVEIDGDGHIREV